MITALVLHYRRPGNLQRVIDGIRRQTIPADIIVWDNSGDAPECGQDVTIRSSRNYDCLPRVLMGGVVKEGYYYSQDDDMECVNPDMFASMVAALKDRPNAVIGYNGKHPDDVTNWDKPYCGPRRSDGDCPMINTGVMFCRAETLNQLRLNPYVGPDGVTAEEYRYGDDMVLSSQWSETILIGVDRMFRRLDEAGGLSFQSQHYPVRHRLYRKYWGTR